MATVLADENFHDAVLTRLAFRQPTLDVVKAKDVGLAATADEVILEWAARARPVNRDSRQEHHANARLREGLLMPGLAYVPFRLSVGTAVVDLELLLLASDDDELNRRVHYLPLRR